MVDSWLMFVNIVNRMLKEAVYAVRRYAEISGEDPAIDMPEFFVPSLILDRLGNEVTFTLETNASKLLR